MPIQIDQETRLHIEHVERCAKRLAATRAELIPDPQIRAARLDADVEDLLTAVELLAQHLE